MRLIYYCDCCQELLEEQEVLDHLSAEQEDFLTEHEQESIMGLQEMPSGQFVSTLCGDCIRELGLNEQALTYRPLLH